MTTIKSADYAQLSWHARQKLNAQLRAETTRLRKRITELRRELTDAGEPPPDIAATIAHAKAILAALPVDPNAQAHRLAIWHDARDRLRDRRGHRKETQ